ncbi:hypothetical protein MYA_3885 [Burkholderia sp. KJ006]|nr:hypothetical protein MYA_3885 [Burkholderia sp. KJ006]
MHWQGPRTVSTSADTVELSGLYLVWMRATGRLSRNMKRRHRSRTIRFPRAGGRPRHHDGGLIQAVPRDGAANGAPPGRPAHARVRLGCRRIL